MTCGVYIIVQRSTGRVYIGSSVNIERRFYDHRHALRFGAHHNAFLQRAWMKSSEQDFVFEIVAEVEQSSLPNVELDCMMAFPREQLFNLCLDPTNGTRGLHWAHTEETKRKIARALTGTKRGPYKAGTGENIAKALRGKTRSAESIAKQQETQRQNYEQGLRRPHSEETKRKIGEANKGKTLGRPKSEQTRQKMAESARRARARRKNDLP